MSEQWKIIEGFPDYAVSDLGNVMSKKSGKWQFLKHSVTSAGYLRVNLSNSVGRRVCFIHRLVAVAFILNPDDLPQVNHINGIKTDNTVENLEWLSQADNIKHAFASGLMPLGAACSNYDHTVYRFIHPEHGVFIGTGYELRIQYSLFSSGVRNLIKGKLKTCKGWKLWS